MNCCKAKKKNTQEDEELIITAFKTPNPNKWDSLLTENKLYRAPPTPPPRRLNKLEQGFTLDCIAVGNIANDYFKVNPKVGNAIPTYNSQLDPMLKDYFASPTIQDVLQRTGEVSPGTCMEGEAEERFEQNGAAREYLKRRNVHGCGRSMYEMAGHISYADQCKLHGE